MPFQHGEANCVLSLLFIQCWLCAPLSYIGGNIEVFQMSCVPHLKRFYLQDPQEQPPHWQHTTTDLSTHCARAFVYCEVLLRSFVRLCNSKAAFAQLAFRQPPHWHAALKCLGIDYTVRFFNTFFLSSSTRPGFGTQLLWSNCASLTSIPNIDAVIQETGCPHLFY